MSFEMNVMLDTGLYDFRSVGSKDGFLILGPACFCDLGKCPWLNDVLTMFVMTGARTSANCFITHVGAGVRNAY